MTPLLPVDPTQHVTNFPVFQKYFHIEVSHVESINIVYIQNIFHAEQLAQLLDDLFITYENGRFALSTFMYILILCGKLFTVRRSLEDGAIELYEKKIVFSPF